MRILWLAHDANMSGANVCLMEFLQLLKMDGVDNDIIIPRPGDICERVDGKVHTVYPVKFYSWNWPMGSKPPLEIQFRRILRNKKAVTDIAKIIRETNPDFVVSNTVVTPVAAKAAQREGKRHIWFIHEFGEEDHGYIIGGGFSKAARKINLLSYKVAFVSEAVRKKYQPYITADKQFIVHNAMLSTSLPAKLYEGKKLELLMLGQIAPAKNQLEAVKALKTCIDKGLKMRLTIIGKADEPDYLNILTDFIQEADLKTFVTISGPTTTAHAFFEAHEVLLMCSRCEAFGRVTGEALKSGMPVIASNTGGTLEIIRNMENGLLYEAGNSEDLAEKICYYYTHRHLFDRKEIALAAQQQYNGENTRKQLLNIFQ